MPIICFFEGISILMYYRDHFPPHFHIEAGDESAIIGIDPIMIMEGNLSRRNRDKVFAWTAIHQAELRANWELARGRKPLLRIAPLD
jgi:hypothetical protein